VAGFISKPEEKRTLGGSRRRWKNNIKTIFKKEDRGVD
jgi:hypothetical protein